MVVSCTGFWHYTSSYQEQPQIQYLNQSVIQLGNNGQNMTVWSSFGSDVVLQGEELEPNIMVCMYILAFTFILKMYQYLRVVYDNYNYVSQDK